RSSPPAFYTLSLHDALPICRVLVAPKFYLADVGVVNHLAHRGSLMPRSELYGKAFENWVHHELSAHISYRETYSELSYWKLTTRSEEHTSELQSRENLVCRL